jgi:hypothetical protein
MFDALAFDAKDAKEKQRSTKESDFLVSFVGLLSFFAPFASKIRRPKTGYVLTELHYAVSGLFHGQQALPLRLACIVPAVAQLRQT